MNITDDDLGFVYLLNKKKDKLPIIYKTEFEECYSLGFNVYLMSSSRMDNTKFRIVNVNITKKCDEPIGEITVDPSTTEIIFRSHYLGHVNTRIKAKYDDLEKNWDVRYINGTDEKLTKFPDVFFEVLNNSNYGLEEKENFKTMINLSKNVFNEINIKKK